MAGTLLLRGMLIGIIAGLLCFSFLKIVGEPQVDRAIAFETQLDEAKAHGGAQALIAKGLPAAGAQLIMWTTIGLLFGALAERLLAQPAGVVQYSGVDSSRRRRALW